MLWLTIASSAAAVMLGLMLWRARRTEERRSAARVAALADAIDHVTDDRVPLLFTPPRSSSAADHPLLKVAAGFVLVVTLIVVMALANDPRPAPAASPVAGARTEAPLTLLAMRHERDGDALVVTGLVGLHGGTRADGLVATIVAFDRAGAVVASGRAPLDSGSPAPGAAAPFRIVVPDAAHAGRYRVGFRDGAGVVRHLDRRNGSPHLSAQGTTMRSSRAATSAAQ
jgi:hypothetical protein